MPQIAFWGGLLLATPVAMGSESGSLEVRERAGTGAEAKPSAGSPAPGWSQTCQPPLNCEVLKEQRIQHIRSGTLVRAISLVPGQVLEVYRDASGRLDVAEREWIAGKAGAKGRQGRGGQLPASDAARSRDAHGNTTKEGDFCFDCFEENESQLISMVLSLKEIQNNILSRRNLKRIGSFFESRSGVLIHEMCFDQYGDQVEKWVTDATIEGLSCHLNTEETYSYRTNKRGASYYSHIPRLMNLFTKDSLGGAFADGMLVHMNGKTEIFENPCEGYKSWPLDLESKIHKNNCEFDGRFNLKQPKIICQRDKLELAVNEYNERSNYAMERTVAYASNPGVPRPAYVNWKGKTEVYNQPFISFVTKDRKLSEEQFKAIFWHELLHNAGYGHEEDGHPDDEGRPDYAYFCSAACFRKSYDFSDTTVGGARNQCELPERSDTTPSFLEDIRRTIGTH